MLFGDFNTSILLKKNSHNLRVGSRGVHRSGKPDQTRPETFRWVKTET